MAMPHRRGTCRIRDRIWRRKVCLYAGREDWDTTEVLLRNDGFALFRAQSELTLPSPPGCAFRGCINGPRTRGHLEQLQAALGWPSAETDEDRVWVPLLLH